MSSYQNQAKERQILRYILSMAPPKNHAVGDILIVVKLESIWFICCILMENFIIEPILFQS